MTVRVGLLIAAVLALIALGAWLSRAAWKPALDRAAAAAFDARDRAGAADLGRAGDARVSEAMQDWARQGEVARDVAADFQRSTREDPDAALPLEADRLARLRDADRRLCRLRPGLGGCQNAGQTAAADDAGPGATVLSSDDARP